MTHKETCEYIVEHNGACGSVSCENCPFYNVDCELDEDVLKMAQDWLKAHDTIKSFDGVIYLGGNWIVDWVKGSMAQISNNYGSKLVGVEFLTKAFDGKELDRLFKDSYPEE